MTKSTHLSRSFVLLTTLVFALPVAHAVEYKTVALEKSKVTFNYQQMGVSLDGQFKKFTPQLSFDLAKAANAKASIEIELASVDTGSSEADDEVVGKSWFNVKSFPKALFVSTQVKPAGTNLFEVTGKLTIKGQTRDVTFVLKHTPQGSNGLLSGGFTIKRGDFAIGEGPWAKFDVVANDIQINFQLTAQSGK
jgi:polyisoprenoid-binding protein YceI